MQNGFELAREDINNAGGPNGMNVELHFEDSNSASTQGVNAATKLVDTTGVDAVFGAVSSGVTISIAESVTVPNEVLHVTPASSSPVISTLDDDDYVWRTRTNDRFVARVMSRIAQNNDASSAAVLYVNNDFGSALADVFEESFDGEVTAKVGYESGASSYQQSLEELFADDPDYVALAGYPESGTTILAVVRGRLRRQLGAPHQPALQRRHRERRRRSDERHVRRPHEAAERRRHPELRRRLRVGVPRLAAVLAVLLELLRRADVVGARRPQRGQRRVPDVKEQMRPVTNPEGEAVGYGEFQAGVDALDNGSDIDYSGPSGNVNYDENGDVASDMVVVQVVDGSFEDQETIPASELV